MEKRGEITVFLSLILVCVLSLILGILESARTAGARLYLRMAADSAMDSMLSQYNRNLWETYRLLFLEYETPEAIKTSFESYLDYYLEQENFYPMKRKGTEITELVRLEDDGAKALEQEILDYIKYRLPDVAAQLAGIVQIPDETAKAGDFKELLKTCRQAGRRTRKLEKARQKIEDSLEKMWDDFERAMTAASEEREGKFRTETEKILKESRKFSVYVSEYEKELEGVKLYLEDLKSREAVKDTEAAAAGLQEVLAYGEVTEAAILALETYRDMEITLENGRQYLEEALEFLDEGMSDSEGNGGDEEKEEEEKQPDWTAIKDCMEAVEIPVSSFTGKRDEEKAAALDRIEELLDKDLLLLVLPEGMEVSNKRVSLGKSPSERNKGAGMKGAGAKDTGAAEDHSVDLLLVNEYIFLYFDSFVEKSREAGLPQMRPLSYEQEYILCGKAADRENLKAAVEELLAVRGASNLLYLLSSADKKSSADALAASVSAGSIPVQIVLSFLILSLWAFGESILDLRILLDGGKVPIWKDDLSWRLGIEELLSLGFLNDRPEGGERGYQYKDYMRILFLMENRQKKNFRILDLIEWNVRTKQEDFRVNDCAYEIEIQTEVFQRHLFSQKQEYETSLRVRQSY